jgi:hypothetical protein
MPLRRTRVLLGFMPHDEAERFLRGRSPDVPAGASEFKRLWQAASTRAARGPAPKADARPQPLKAPRHVARLAKQPRFREVVARHRWSLQTVAIDALLSVQRRVDEGFASKSVGDIDPDDAAAVLEVALPLSSKARPVQTKVERRAVTLSTDSPDLRVLQPFTSYDPASDRTTVGFTVGWGSPFVTVARVGSRLVLKNGYHRVYGLRAFGVERVPAVVLEARRMEEAGAGRPGFSSGELLSGPRPPTVASFFDDAVSVSVRVPTVTRFVRVHAEDGLADP